MAVGGQARALPPALLDLELDEFLVDQCVKVAGSICRESVVSRDSEPPLINSSVASSCGLSTFVSLA
ncbi:hypothetical protein AWV80_14445 [Cupriavidus sp. UYMU48A]|nr:hypothetical protein AWV80_14445 [Cupriavidus sp. UYMU48A]